MADSSDEKKKKTIKNYSNDYNPYWNLKNDETKATSPDIPEYHIFISHQKMDTETGAVHYESQDNNSSSNSENKTSTTTSTSTSTSKTS
ncbi:hypothetical protein [Methanosphaera sp.]